MVKGVIALCRHLVVPIAFVRGFRVFLFRVFLFRGSVPLVFAFSRSVGFEGEQRLRQHLKTATTFSRYA